MRTIVVNLRHSKCDARIDRTTIFGNPFKMKNQSDKERDRVCDKYEAYFHERIIAEPWFCDAVLGLRGKRLGCWCKPKRCHGDIIVEWLEKTEND